MGNGNRGCLLDTGQRAVYAKGGRLNRVVKLLCRIGWIDRLRLKVISYWGWIE